MKKLLNKPWFVVALVLAAVALVGHSLLEQRRGRLPVASADGVEATLPPGEMTLEDGSSLARLPAREALAALVLPAAAPDPFVRRRAEEIVPEHDKGEDPDLVDTLRLSATWSQGAVTLALLNDRICRAGEVIGRVQIDSVSIDGVWLRHWKGRDFLPVGREFTLVTPARQAAAATFALHEG